MGKIDAAVTMMMMQEIADAYVDAQKIWDQNANRAEGDEIPEDVSHLLVVFRSRIVSEMFLQCGPRGPNEAQQVMDSFLSQVPPFHPIHSSATNLSQKIQDWLIFTGLLPQPDLPKPEASKILTMQIYTSLTVIYFYRCSPPQKWTWNQPQWSRIVPLLNGVDISVSAYFLLENSEAPQ
jgi:hypothetical protein